MKLKNEALQKLYETIVNGSFSFSPYAECPIDKAFAECDEKLQKGIDIWRRSNEILLSANGELAGEKRQLQQDHESDVRVIGKLHSQMVNLEDEKTEQEKRADNLQKEIKQLKLDLDALLNRAHCAEDEAEDLKNKCSVREERIKELIDRLEKVSSDRDELQKDRDIWVRNNCEKQAEIAELKKQLDGALEAKKAVNDSRYKWAQKWLSTKQNLETKLNEAEVKYRRLEKEHEELSIENKRLRNSVRSGYDQGQTDLWVKLQDVKDMQPNEFDVECECLGDVIDMDLEDFLDVYKEWYEQKDIDRMRKWLADFCYGRDRKGCPLESEEEKSKPGELVITTRGVTTANYTEATMNAIKEAVRKFEKSLPALDSWESTITGSIKVDDILGKINGTEHKLEYGDAVRVPWRDYDYMYIGPEAKHIRLFDPKSHTVIFVSPSEKLTYQGCKIVLTDEDDLRKIWKDMK